MPVVARFLEQDIKVKTIRQQLQLNQTWCNLPKALYLITVLMDHSSLALVDNNKVELVVNNKVDLVVNNKVDSVVNNKVVSGVNNKVDSGVSLDLDNKASDLASAVSGVNKEVSDLDHSEDHMDVETINKHVSNT